MNTTSPKRIRFVSRPCFRRIGLIPMTVAIVLACTLVALDILRSTLFLDYSKLWSFISVFPVLGLAACAVILTLRFIQEGKQHELQIDGDSIILSTFDERQGTKDKEQISLKEVFSAEYFVPLDTSSLLLNGSSNSLEIPLWSFGPDAEREIVGQIQARGVQILGIPTDILI